MGTTLDYIVCLWHEITISEGGRGEEGEERGDGRGKGGGEGKRECSFFFFLMVESRITETASLVLYTHTHTRHSLEMLDKLDIPVIADGYPLVVAMNALLDAIKSISQVVNGEATATPTFSEVMPTPGTLI